MGQGGDDRWDAEGQIPVPSHTLRVHRGRACDIIVACVILTNIATIRGEQCSPLHPFEIFLFYTIEAIYHTSLLIIVPVKKKDAELLIL